MKAVILSSLVFLLSCGTEDAGCKEGTVEYKLINDDKTLIKEECINNQLIENEISQASAMKVENVSIVIEGTNICIPPINDDGGKLKRLYDEEYVDLCENTGNIGKAVKVFAWDNSEKWVKKYMILDGEYIVVIINDALHSRFVYQFNSPNFEYMHDMKECDIESTQVIATKYQGATEYYGIYQYKVEYLKRKEGYSLCTVSNTAIGDIESSSVCHYMEGINVDNNFDGVIDEVIEGFIWNKSSNPTLWTVFTQDDMEFMDKKNNIVYNIDVECVPYNESTYTKFMFTKSPFIIIKILINGVPTSMVPSYVGDTEAYYYSKP